jgi:hypothetical protein
MGSKYTAIFWENFYHFLTKKLGFFLKFCAFSFELNYFAIFLKKIIKISILLNMGKKEKKPGEDGEKDLFICDLVLKVYCQIVNTWLGLMLPFDQLILMLNEMLEMNADSIDLIGSPYQFCNLCLISYKTYTVLNIKLCIQGFVF